MRSTKQKFLQGTTAAVLGTGAVLGGVTAFGSDAAHASTTKNPAACHAYGHAGAAQTKIIAAACKEVANHTKYSWDAGHGKKPGKTTGAIYNQGGEYWNDTHKVGFDCSGLVRWAVYKGTGKDIGPGGTSIMNNEFRRAHWTKVSKATQPGDVIVYDGHTVIYLGGGKVVQAEGDAEGLNVASKSSEHDRVIGIWRYHGAAGKTPTPPPTKPAPPKKGSPHKKIYKNVWAQASSYTKPSHGTKVGVLHKGRNYFFCQSKGSEVHFSGYRNNWWVKTDDDSGHRNVWVNATHLSGGHNDGKIPGIPAC